MVRMDGRVVMIISLCIYTGFVKNASDVPDEVRLEYGPLATRSQTLYVRPFLLGRTGSYSPLVPRRTRGRVASHETGGYGLRVTTSNSRSQLVVTTMISLPLR